MLISFFNIVTYRVQALGSQTLCLCLFPILIQFALFLQSLTLTLDADASEDTEHGRNVDKGEDCTNQQTTD